MSGRIVERLQNYSLMAGQHVRIGSTLDPTLAITLQGLNKNGVCLTARSHNKAVAYAVVHRRHKVERSVDGHYMPLIIWRVVYVFTSGRCFVHDDITGVGGTPPRLPQRTFQHLRELAGLEDEQCRDALSRMPIRIRLLNPPEMEEMQRRLVEWRVVG